MNKPADLKLDTVPVWINGRPVAPSGRTGEVFNPATGQVTKKVVFADANLVDSAVKARERDRLAIHYHQSYQVRRFRRRKPEFLLAPAKSDYPMVHLFDEPQFNVQDGYIGFMLDFFRRLKGEGRAVFVCVHPTERYHLEILREVCERFIFVERGKIALFPDYAEALADARVAAYLGEGARA